MSGLAAQLASCQGVGHRLEGGRVLPVVVVASLGDGECVGQLVGEAVDDGAGAGVRVERGGCAAVPRCGQRPEVVRGWWWRASVVMAAWVPVVSMALDVLADLAREASADATTEPPNGNDQDGSKVALPVRPGLLKASPGATGASPRGSRFPGGSRTAWRVNGTVRVEPALSTCP